MARVLFNCQTKLIYGALLGLALISGGWGDSSSLLAQAPIEATSVMAQSAAFEAEVIRLTNLERTARGLLPLSHNVNLTQAAQAHNQDMITHDFFAHTGSDGSTPSQRACMQGYTAYGWGECFVAENIGAGYATPASMVTGWMNSQGHRANILNSAYREIGVGYASGGEWGHYWTMDLGAQPNVLPVFINNDVGATFSNGVTVALTKEDVSNWGSMDAITGVKLSEDPAFTGITWQSWSRTTPFTLSPGLGQKTIYVRFTDGTKQVTSSDTITLVEPGALLYLPAIQN